jgi:hypothetical protein
LADGSTFALIKRFTLNALITALSLIRHLAYASTSVYLHVMQVSSVVDSTLDRRSLSHRSAVHVMQVSSVVDSTLKMQTTELGKEEEEENVNTPWWVIQFSLEVSWLFIYSVFKVDGLF